MAISRRDILKSLTLTAVTGSVLRVIPLEAAAYAHRVVRAERMSADDQVYAPKFFSAHAYKTLQALCQTIIPSDDDAKGPQSDYLDRLWPRPPLKSRVRNQVAFACRHPFPPLLFSAPKTELAPRLVVKNGRSPRCARRAAIDHQLDGIDVGGVI